MLPTIDNVIRILEEAIAIEEAIAKEDRKKAQDSYHIDHALKLAISDVANVAADLQDFANKGFEGYDNAQKTQATDKLLNIAFDVDALIIALKLNHQV